MYNNHNKNTDGGKVKKKCDLSLFVPHSNVTGIQEGHIFLDYYVPDEVEKNFLATHKKN